MTTFVPSNSNIHIIARALLTRGDDIIVCNMKGSEHGFFPGGHVENGESAEVALKRELAEELGISVSSASFIGVCENLFSPREGVMQHEINLVYHIELPDDAVVTSQEGHIEFAMISKESLASRSILPVTLKQGIIEWMKTGKMFYIPLA